MFVTMILTTTYEGTREFMLDLLVDATLGRALEAVVVAFAGYFWRTLVGLVRKAVKRIVQRSLSFLTAVRRSVHGAGRTRRVTAGRFGSGRRSEANWGHPRVVMLLPC